MFTRCIVIAVPDHKRDNVWKLTYQPNSRIEATPLSDSPGQYLATMQTVLNPESDPADPYTVDMECIGFFSVDDTLEPDEAMRGVTITAHNVLYGAIREAVSWLTGRQPYGPLALGLSILQSARGESKSPADAPKGKG